MNKSYAFGHCRAERTSSRRDEANSKYDNKNRGGCLGDVKFLDECQQFLRSDFGLDEIRVGVMLSGHS